MKQMLITSFTCILLFSCQSQSYNELNGIWEVDSQFYKASYRIEDHSRNQKCEVIYYDDGTSEFRKNESSPYYLFERIKSDNGQLVAVDGVSGATVMADRFILEPLGHDTLQVTSYIGDQPLIENWIRKKSIR